MDVFHCGPKPGGYSAIEFRLAPDDLQHWEEISQALRQMLVVMGQADARRHREMTARDYAGLCIIQPSGGMGK